MQVNYTVWSGVELMGQDKLSEFLCQLTEFVLGFGPRALDAMADLGDDQARTLDGLVQRGLIERRNGRLDLTDRAIAAMEQQCLAGVLARLGSAGLRRPDAVTSRSRVAELDAATRRIFGDNVTERDLAASLRSAVARNVSLCPIAIQDSDLDQWLIRCTAPLSVAVVIDLNWAMSRFGRLPAAKKVAMALRALARQRFEGDTVDVIAFDSTARRLTPRELLLLTASSPPARLADTMMSLAADAADDAPRDYSNLQAGLKLAADTLAHSPQANHKLILTIAASEPTACEAEGRLILARPGGEPILKATLAQARHAARAGVHLATFGLIDDASDMDWVDFVEHLTRATRGTSFYCGSEDLSGCVMEAYLSSKRA